MAQNEYPYESASQQARNMADMPMLSGQDSGEGSLVYAGDDVGNEPVTLLPNPGEGGPVAPSNNVENEPVILLPNPGEGGPVAPSNNVGNGPVILLPNPGEGGPVAPGNTTFPFFPGTGNNSGNTNNSGNNNSGNSNNFNNAGAAILQGLIGSLLPNAVRVRFLNAAYGYPAFRVYIGNTQFVNLLNYASVTNYGRIGAGYRTITVTGTDGYVYLQKTLPFQANSVTTIAIINSASGMDLLQITDSCCPPTNGYSSFRIGNLAYNSGPLDVLMSDGRVVYSDLRFKEVGAFKRIRPGTYQFFYANTNLSPMPVSQDIETLDSSWLGVYPPYETFGSLFLNVTSNMIYTVYLLQSGSGRNNIQNLILRDQ